ncbi:dihydroxyacetone kinase subunit DhaL [Aminivibrio sp.]
MNSFANRDGAVVVREMIRVIGENRAYLSEIDGAIGDGDHGVNMDKGFSLCLSRVDWETADFTTAMKTLSRILLMEIGGSMGPIYGTFFDQIAKGAKGRERIDGSAFSAMLGSAASEIEKLGGAVRGDKTLLDSLLPAVEAFDASFEETGDFAKALTALQAAAEEGRESTRDMVARVGRASRLGERSRGVLDAGATSCCLLLNSMAESVKKLLKEE